MSSRKAWSRDELLIAFYLYCQLPFGQFHHRNKTIIEHAKRMRRTPSSLAMKLSNIASLDPAITTTGRVGLKGASSADRAMWGEMTADWALFAIEAESAANKLVADVAESDGGTSTEPMVDYIGVDRTTLTKTRVGQDFFRRAVLSAYEYRCCISGLALMPLLVASHIKPWKDDSENRLNPHNGLCLSALHDKAFDYGIITLTKDLRVKVADHYKTKPDEFFKKSILRFEGKQIYLPAKFGPSIELIEYHRDVVFQRN
jgi:putative restriction endonuclease